MYPVSALYKEAIKQNNRTFKLMLTILPASEISLQDIDAFLSKIIKWAPNSIYTITSPDDVKEILKTVVTGVEMPDKYVIYDEAVLSNTFSYSSNIVTSEDFDFGNCISSTCAFSLLNNEGQWDLVDLSRATVVPMIGLLVGDTYEYVPIGTFWIDTVGKGAGSIKLTALDSIAKLTKSFSELPVIYPITLESLYASICAQCNIKTRVTTFRNGTTTITQAPIDTDDSTCRDVLQYIAQAAGGNFQMGRDDYLEFIDFTSGDTIQYTPKDRMSFLPENFTVNVTGLKYTKDDTLYSIGTNDYVLELSENPLLNVLSDDALNSVLNNILSYLSQIYHTPFTSKTFGDPAVDCGDNVINEHISNRVYSSYVTNVSYKFKGACTLQGKGRVPEVVGQQTAQSKNDKRIVNLIRQSVKDSDEKFSDVEQSIIDLTATMTSELGGYCLKTHNALYFMDAETLEASTKYWKAGLAGLGYTSDGGNSFTWGLDMYGRLNADIITAGHISGERITAGTITASQLTGQLLLEGDRISIKSQRFVLGYDGTVTSYGGSFSIYTGTASTPGNKVFGADSEGNILLNGYISMIGSKTKARVGTNASNNEGFYVTEAKSVYLKADGSYAPYFEVWNDVNNNTHITGLTNLYLNVKDKEATYDNYRLRIDKNGGSLYGTWDVDSYNVLSYTKLIVNNTQIGSIDYDSSGAYALLRMVTGWGFGITFDGSYRFSVNNAGGILYGEWSIGGTTKMTAEQFVVNQASFRNKLYLRDENSSCASFYRSTTDNPVLRSDNGKTFYISGSGVKIPDGVLEVVGDIQTGARLRTYSGQWLLDMADSDMWVTKLGGINRVDVVTQTNSAFIQMRASTFTPVSDPQYKKNVHECLITDAIAKINQLKFYSYEMKNKFDDTTNFSDGMMISEVQEDSHINMGVLTTEAPEEIKSAEGDAIDLYSYVSLCAKAIQELSQIIGGLTNGTETDSTIG